MVNDLDMSPEQQDGADQREGVSSDKTGSIEATDTNQSAEGTPPSDSISQNPEVSTTPLGFEGQSTLAPATAAGPSFESHPTTRIRVALGRAREDVKTENMNLAVRGTGGAQRGGGRSGGITAEGGRPPGRGIGRREFLIGTGIAVGGAVVATELQTGFLKKAVNFLRGKNNKAVVPPASPTATNTPEITASPTLEATTTPEPTSTPEPAPEYPEFMPDAKRNVYGDISLATDSEYPDRKECPDPHAINKTTACSPMNELVLREESFEVEGKDGLKIEKTSRELLDEGTDNIKALAWMRLSKGLSVEEITMNYDSLFAEYQDLKLKGADVSFDIYGFNEQNDYSNPAVLTIDPSYKIEYMYVPLPNKYTNIELQSSFKAGFVANTVKKKLYIVMYDFAAGGIGNDNINQAVPLEYHPSSAIVWAGVLLSDKTAQTNQKVSNHATLRPIGLKLEESFIPYKTDTLWKGIVVAR